MKRNLIILTLCFCVMLTMVYSDYAMGEIIGCAGQKTSSTTSSGDTIISNSSFVLRNFNDSRTININRIVVYDSDGNERCVYPTAEGSFPGTVTDSLPPHQSARFATMDMGCITSQPFPAGSLQILIDWSFQSGKTGEPLYVTSIGLNLNFTDDYHFGWAPLVCRPIAPK